MDFERFGFLRTAHGSQTEPVVFQACRHIGVFRSKDILENGHRTLEKRFGLRVLTLVIIEQPEVI